MKIKQGESLNVLIVDDEPEIRETLRMFLETMEIFSYIVEAGDGSEAFRKVQNQQFDLIITDLMMPKVRGLELIQTVKTFEAKKNPGEPPAIFVILSANLTGLEVKKAIAFGVKHALTKPCTAQAFLEKITFILKKELSRKIKAA